jgi:single-strand DNA-binding protein
MSTRRDRRAGKEAPMAANAIMLSGNLTKDPELKYLQGTNGSPDRRAVVTFRIAVDDAGKGDEAGFFTCSAWGSLAENLAVSLKKGQRVVVAGAMRHRSFEVEGKPRTAIEVSVIDAGPSLLWATAEVTRQAREQETPSAAAQPIPEPVGA